MKSRLIAIIKKNPILYRIARGVYRQISGRQTDQLKEPYQDPWCYAVYVMTNLNELQKIKDHYASINLDKSRLLILVNNSEYNILIHDLMTEEDLDIMCLDYFKKYNYRAKLQSSIVLDYNSDKMNNVINYIKLR